MPASAAATPAALASAESWIPAPVPGTVAAALQAARPGAPIGDLHAHDHWYRLDAELPGDAWLEFAGLATLAEIWLDGRLAASSASMFLPLTVPVPASGARRLEICFRALRPALRTRPRGRRPRWRGRLAVNEALRNHRTILLGHMPNWSGTVPAIGPFRPRTQPGLSASLRGDAGTWTVDVSTRGFAQFLHLDDDFVAADSHFHLWPGESRTVALHQLGRTGSSPAGTISALNAHAAAHYGIAA